MAGALGFEVLLKPEGAAPVSVGEFTVGLRCEASEVAAAQVHVDAPTIAEGLRALAEALSPAEGVQVCAERGAVVEG